MRIAMTPLPVLVIEVDAIPSCPTCYGKAYGPVSLIRRAADTSTTEAHEITHARIWWTWMLAGIALYYAALHFGCPVAWAALMLGMAGDGVAGKLVTAYRRWEEVTCFASELDVLGWPEAQITLRAKWLAEAYDLGLTAAEAERLLRDRR